MRRAFRSIPVTMAAVMGIKISSAPAPCTTNRLPSPPPSTLVTVPIARPSLVSTAQPKELLEKVKSYTHGDTFKPIAGHTTFTSHYHSRLTVGQLAGRSPVREFAYVFKQMGVGLAVAILLDATLVRAVLLPATMKLLGERNWYLPRQLRWLPKWEHEHAPEAVRA